MATVLGGSPVVTQGDFHEVVLNVIVKWKTYKQWDIFTRTRRGLCVCVRYAESEPSWFFFFFFVASAYYLDNTYCRVIKQRAQDRAGQSRRKWVCSAAELPLRDLRRSWERFKRANTSKQTNKTIFSDWLHLAMKIMSINIPNGTPDIAGKFLTSCFIRVIVWHLTPRPS